MKARCAGMGDWNSWNVTCLRCKRRYHTHEEGCNCIDGYGRCAGCDIGLLAVKVDHYPFKRWHRINALSNFDGQNFCENHLVCSCCDRTEDEIKDPIRLSEERDVLFCSRCIDAPHTCPPHDTVLDEI